MAYLFDDLDLPNGFKFPQDFINVISLKDIPQYDPWWFLAKFPDRARAWFNMLETDFPARRLIPFAKYNADPEVACFDGNDVSGDPIVYYVQADASPGKEISGSEPNFAAWLERTKKESAVWLSAGSGESSPTS